MIKGFVMSVVLGLAAAVAVCEPAQAAQAGVVREEEMAEAAETASGEDGAEAEGKKEGTSAESAGETEDQDGNGASTAESGEDGDKGLAGSVSGENTEGKPDAAEEPVKDENPTAEAPEGEDKEIGSGPQLIMLKNSGPAQMLSILIRSKNGRLMVIDGGWEEDGDYLLEHIKKYGGQVDAWLITHPHPDHAGALNYILQHKSGEITIDKIYGSFASSEWYWKASPEEAPFVDTFLYELSQLPPGTVWSSVGKGFEIDMDGLRITALNNRYELPADSVNNSSIAYLLEAGERRALFLGDLGYEGGQRLMKDADGKLQADIVQMAHHGQNGVGRQVYQAIAPRICLWPTPQWLWDNDTGEGEGTGPWRTAETRKWIEEMEVEENYCTKDGDIVLGLE